jgi:hypothetical protein
VEMRSATILPFDKRADERSVGEAGRTSEETKCELGLA